MPLTCCGVPSTPVTIKHYIFGLLFYERLCDVWEEEYEERLAEYDESLQPYFV